jgi:hypothetical protein
MLLAAGLSTLLGGAVLSAQTNQLMADIPFAFHASGKVLPAGTYVLSKETAQGIFQVRNRADSSALYVMAPIAEHYRPRESKLVFVHSGDEYILQEIAIAGTAFTNAVTPAAIEKNRTRKLGFSSMISVPLHR